MGLVIREVYNRELSFNEYETYLIYMSTRHPNLRNRNKINEWYNLAKEVLR